MPRLRLSAIVAVPGLCLLLVSPLIARQAPPATLTLTVKNSPAYAQPTPVPVPTALLVVTPSWAGLGAKTPAGGSEVPGQTLFLSELAVVLSSRPADCSTVFALGAPENDKDFHIVAGKAEAYMPRREWKSTTVGKVLADATSEQKIRLAVERFSATIQGAGLKKKAIVKDGLGGASRLVLDQNDGKWTADIALKVDDVVAEGKIPLTACPTEPRSKTELPPLLGEGRLMNAARTF
jgi:hypothetical protein